MPHFGLMDESRMEPAEAALLRARLHLRSGRRRLRQSKLAAGLSTVYDALVSGMRWYVLTHPEKFPGGLDLEDEPALFETLCRAGVMNSAYNFQELEAQVGKAVHRQPLEVDWQAELAAIEEQLLKLEVLPFAEESLPPEDPATF